MAEDWPEASMDSVWTRKPTRRCAASARCWSTSWAGTSTPPNAGAARAASWDEVDPKTLNGKAAIVAAYKKSMDDAVASLKAIPPEQFQKTLAPWLSVIEHDAEHYGQLIAYYRANGVVPPSSRKRRQPVAPVAPRARARALPPPPPTSR